MPTMNNSMVSEKIVFIREASSALRPAAGGVGIGLAAGLHVAGVGDDLLLVGPDHAATRSGTW